MSTTKTTSSGNGARAKPKHLKTSPPPCRAVALIRQWMTSNGLDVAKVARKIDRTWDCTNNIVTGKERPNIDAVVFFRDEAGVPISAWMEAGK